MTVYYTEQHEWISVADGVATVGITRHAAEQLGDVVFVELPDVGKSIAINEAVAVVESVKAASDVFTPVTGMVMETNQNIVGEPANVNADPEGAAWFFKVKLSDVGELDGLMNKTTYDAFVADNG